jgi:hypothetical protein
MVEKITNKKLFTTEELDLSSPEVINELDETAQSELAEVLKFELEK